MYPDKENLRYFKADLLSGAVHAFLCRPSKEHLTETPLDERGLCRAHLEEAGSLLRFRSASIIMPNQVHGVKVIAIKGSSSRGEAAAYAEREGDAVVTNTPYLPIGVRTADCVPVLLFDKEKKTIGAAHAGWRGAAKGVIRETIRSMTSHFKSDPAKITAAIGPHIGPCCYTVGEELSSSFRDALPDSEGLFNEEGGTVHFDLGLAVKSALIEAGLDSDNITRTEDSCTSCHKDILYSYRADPDENGRQLSIIMLKN